MNVPMSILTIINAIGRCIIIVYAFHEREQRIIVLNTNSALRDPNKIHNNYDFITPILTICFCPQIKFFPNTRCAG